MEKNIRKRDRESDRNTNKVKTTSQDRVRPTHSPEGVDLTLIRWFLTLTPMERLRALESQMKAIQAIRDANPDL